MGNRFENMEKRRGAAGVYMPNMGNADGATVFLALSIFGGMITVDTVGSAALDVVMLPALWLYRQIFGEPETEDPNVSQQ